MKLFKLCSSVIVVLLLSSVILIGCGNSAPAAPTGVTATPGNGQVTIAWTAVPDATSYNIYWSTTSGVTPTNGSLIAECDQSLHPDRADQRNNLLLCGNRGKCQW